jgi:hypothetical protein
MSNYFLSQSPGFGPLSWLALLGWGLLLAAGLYLYNSWQERNPVRARFIRQLGFVLSILAGTGVVLLALKGLHIPVLSYRIWVYLVALATVIYGVWAAYKFQRMQQLVAASGRTPAVTRRLAPQPGRGARTYSSNGPTGAETRPIPPQRPVATTGRREARRDKKRKGR